MTVICAGGGGIPVVPGCAGQYCGVEAVVDKDLTAALLAEAVGADALLLLTDVEAVLDGFGTAHPRPLRRVTPGELRAHSFPAGSMGPKVEAACRFAELTGGLAAIGRLDDAAALLSGQAWHGRARRLAWPAGDRSPAGSGHAALTRPAHRAGK